MKIARGMNFIKAGLFVLVFVFTFIVRASGYDRTPGFGHLEELLYSWSGMYLLEEGVPVSWSTLEYPKKNVIFKGFIGSKHTPDTRVAVDLMRPWLDEPPLYSLLVGSVARLFGADRHEIIPTAYVRIPSIVFATGVSILVFALASRFFGYWIGLFSMLLYGTIPIIVFGSRLAVPENAFAFTYLLSIVLTLVYIRKPKFGLITLLVFLAGLSGLMKPTGFFIAPFVAFLLARHKLWRAAIAVVLLQSPFVAMFIYYGTSFDAGIFWRLVEIQGFRPAGWSALAFIFSMPGFDISQFFDGWYVFAMLMVVYFALKNYQDEKIQLLVAATLYWLVIVVLSGGQQDMLPWYRYPIFPYLAIFAALGAKELIINPTFAKTALAAGMLLSSRYYLVNAFKPDVMSLAFRWRFAALVLPSVALEIWHISWLTRLSQLAIAIIIVVSLFWNAKLIMHSFDLRCESMSCGFGPTTRLSELHLPLLWRLFSL